jgi:RNA polymerase sigma-70 factor (ECF subfamily)
LPKKLRDALLLAGSGEHSYEEIGQMLKIPVGTVKWRVSEARKVLKQKMSAMGYSDVR